MRLAMISPRLGITEAGYNSNLQQVYRKVKLRLPLPIPSLGELGGGFMVGTPNKDAGGGVQGNQGVSAKYAITKDGATSPFASLLRMARQLTTMYLYIYNGMPPAI